MAASTKTWLNNNPPAVEDDDLNGFAAENNNLITGSGQSLSTSDSQQTHKAVSVYAHGGNFYTDGGAADAYVLSVVGAKVAPPSYFVGMTIKFVAGNTNTGASTINVATLGTTALKRGNGTDLTVGYIVTGLPYEFRYDGTNFVALGESFYPTETGETPADIVTYEYAFAEPTLDARRYGVRASGSDESAEFLNAIDALGGNGGSLLLPRGTIVLDSPVLPTAAQAWNLIIKGHGPNQTILEATHSSGPVLRLNRTSSQVLDLKITASTARNTGAAGSNYGLLFEPEDAAGRAIAKCNIENVESTLQPNHGFLIVGNAQMSTMTRCFAQSNKGHGFCLDEGVETGRTNRAAPGITTLINCWALSNEGHALCGGNPSDTIGSGAFRTILINFECDLNAQSAGVRHSDDQIWLRGENISVIGSAVGGNSVTGGIYFEGRDGHFTNNRFISCNQSYTIGVDSVNGITKGVVIDGMRVLNVAQNPAIVVEDPANTSQIRVKSHSVGNITSLMTPGVPESEGEINGPVLNIKKKSSGQSVNNTTTLEDDADLVYPLSANESATFRAVVRYNGDSSADIKLAFTGPSGVNIRWGAVSAVLSTSDVVTIPNEKTEGSTLSLGTSASVRWVEVVGRIINGSTAGDFKMQFAQDSAVVADTTVQDGSWLQILRDN